MGGLDSFVEKTLASLFGILLTTYLMLKGMLRWRLALAVAQVYARRKTRTPELPSGRVYLYIPCYVISHIVFDSKSIGNIDLYKIVRFQSTSVEVFVRSAISFLFIESFIYFCCSLLPQGTPRNRMRELARYVFGFSIILFAFEFYLLSLSMRAQDNPSVNSSHAANIALTTSTLSLIVLVAASFLGIIPWVLDRTFVELGAVQKLTGQNVFEKSTNILALAFALSFLSASELRHFFG